MPRGGGSSRSSSRHKRRSPPRRRSPSRRRSRSRRRSSPPPRRRSPSKSRSPPRRKSPARQSSPPPADGGAGGGGEGGAPKAEVVESKARQSTGEPTWRAEILVAKETKYNYDGKARTMCIRGPLRVHKDQAYKDADALEQAAGTGDISKVKALAREMLSTNVH
mmetsp:Transcript_18893/g.34155  ORF Transcript_18893/g.34155 Transcript_18893/m.34155 type:complete len:164 (+) Transcript_18893:31-522(+)